MDWLATPDKDGRIAFRSIKPAGYPIPIDGPTGDLLRAMIKFFEARAWLFVVLAWILCPLVLLVGISVVVSGAISLTYFPQHQQEPIGRFHIRAAYVAMALALIVALASSIALAEKLRRTAIVLVVGSWGVFALGFAVATLLVKPGPEYFQRYAGAEKFLAPWRYQPFGKDQPNQEGFSIRLCLHSLKRTYDEDCGSKAQAWVHPRDRGLEGIPSARGWLLYKNQLTPGLSRDGHELHEGLRSQYFVRRDTEGQITRFVTCSSSSPTCRHHVVTPYYVLAYDAHSGELWKWESMDRNLTDLINSWRVQ